jgi:uncharacterized repeat protein (TIGR02543 family)
MFIITVVLVSILAGCGKDKTVTVTFDANGGSAVDAQVIGKGDEAVTPADPFREGYAFEGWYAGQVEWSFNGQEVDEDLVLEARWTPETYQLTLDLQGGESADGTDALAVTFDAIYGDLPVPSMTGHVFMGWSFDVDGNDMLTQRTRVRTASDHTLYAQWRPDTYTITFDLGHGADVITITQPYGTQLEAPQDPEMEGLVFNGWSEDVPETMPAEDMTISARWTQETLGSIYERNQLAERFEAYDIVYWDDPVELEYQIGFPGVVAAIMINELGLFALEFESQEAMDLLFDEVPVLTLPNLTNESDENYPLMVFFGAKEMFLDDVIITDHFITSQDQKTLFHIIAQSGQRVEIPEGMESLDLVAYGVGQAITLVIPDSVVDIRSLGVYQIVRFEVAQSHPTFASHEGSLYSKDMTGIIRYKSRSDAPGVFPEGLTTIHDYAFVNAGLGTVDIPEGVLSIGQGAFALNEIFEIVIPESVTSIGSAAFHFNRLANVTVEGDPNRFNASWEDIGFPLDLKPTIILDQGILFDPETGSIVGHASAIGTELIIPETIDGVEVTTITDRAFYRASLTSVVIPSSVTHIGPDAFAENDLQSVIIEGDQDRFNDDWERTGFPIALKPTVIHHQGFVFDTDTGSIIDYDSDYGHEVVIPATIEGVDVTTIGDDAFSRNHLTSVVIADSVTRIGDRAFEMNSLADVRFPETLEYIGDFAFSRNQLTDVTIPGNVVSIGGDAFKDNALTDITIGGDANRFNHMWTSLGFAVALMPSLVEQEGFDFDPLTATILDYDANQGHEVVIPSMIEGVPVEHIGAGAFRSKQLTSVVIPDTVTSIGAEAFKWNSLTDLVISEHVVSIGTDAFANTTLVGITIEGDENRFNVVWERIGFPMVLKPTAVSHEGIHFDTETGLVFAYDASFGLEVVIPDAIGGVLVTGIGDGAFINQGLTGVVIPDGVETIGYRAFAYNQLTHVVIPGSVTQIIYGAFWNNPLTDVTIEGDENRFNYVWIDLGFSRSLKPGVITHEGLWFDPDNQAVFDYDPSYGEDVVIPSAIGGHDVLGIESGAFGGHDLSNIVIPETVVWIDSWSFNSMSLTSVTILGDGNRFNEDWEQIGFPMVLKPTAVSHEGIHFDTETGLIFGYDASFGLDVVIPDAIGGVLVTGIGNCAFDGQGLTGIVMPDGVELIGAYAFENNQLTYVMIPQSVTQIMWNAFLNNPLIEVVIEGDEYRFNDEWERLGWSRILKPGVITHEGLWFDADNQAVFDYDFSYGDDVVIPSKIGGYDVLGIEQGAFDDQALSSVVIPETVVWIDSWSFNSMSLTSVTIEGDENRFNDDWETRGFPMVLKPTAVSHDGIHFDTDTGLIFGYDASYGPDVVIPDAIGGVLVTGISNGAFYDDELTSVEIPDGVETIGYSAFARNQLTHVVIPGSVTQINPDAFMDNPLTDVTIEGDETRFNDEWIWIGFPEDLKPEA